MASLESLKTRLYKAQTTSGIVTDDKAVALEIVHVADGATPVVTLASGTGITLADADYTTGSLAFSGFTTLGALADEINANHYLYWKARIVDGLRSTLTASSVLLPNSTITAVTVGGESVYKVFIDTDVNDSVFYRVAQDRGVLRNDDGVLKTELPKGAHRVKIIAINYRQNISAATLNGLRVYEYNPIGTTETLIWSAKTVDDTATEVDFSDNPLTSGEGNEFIVMINDSAITTGGLTNFLQVDYVRE